MQWRLLTTPRNQMAPASPCKELTDRFYPPLRPNVKRVADVDMSFAASGTAVFVCTEYQCICPREIYVNWSPCCSMWGEYSEKIIWAVREAYARGFAASSHSSFSSFLSSVPTPN